MTTKNSSLAVKMMEVLCEQIKERKVDMPVSVVNSTLCSLVQKNVDSQKFKDGEVLYTFVQDNIKVKVTYHANNK